MKNLIRAISPSSFAYLKGIRLLYKRNSYLIQTGLMNTYKVGYPYKPDGKPLPWMNYNTISFLEERLSRNIRLFEFGSGFSTIFFAGLVEEVVSVEYDKQWFDKIKGDLPHNAKIFL